MPGLPGRPDQARLWGLGLGYTACGEHWERRSIDPRVCLISTSFTTEDHIVLTVGSRYPLSYQDDRSHVYYSESEMLAPGDDG
jgi:hypothetical protein